MHETKFDHDGLPEVVFEQTVGVTKVCENPWYLKFGRQSRGNKAALCYEATSPNSRPKVVVSCTATHLPS